MLFLDCEFNGHGGALISLAMVSNTSGKEFYEVLPLDKAYYDSWVMANVVPFLNKKSIPTDEFNKKLREFLTLHAGEIIVADSPADFIYLLDRLHNLKNDKYEMLNLNISMSLVMSDNLAPSMPHNALSDAIALKAWYHSKYKN